MLTCHACSLINACLADQTDQGFMRMFCAGKYMLAHAASAQGISAVENMCDRPHVLNHNSVPAACFTHPEVSHLQAAQSACRFVCERASCLQCRVKIALLNC